MANFSHGGTDALGVPAHDFSTNRNACGPCPAAVAALQSAHVAQYPDPLYTDLRAQLAAFHGVALARVLVGGSSSELIHRFTQHAVRSGARRATLPPHHYGDYLQAAQVWGLAAQSRSVPGPQGLHWACEPSSPLGVLDEVWSAWAQLPAGGPTWRMLDCAYRPLWLEGTAPQRDLDTVWQLWTPNKALGMTGVRAAYAIAPLHAAAQELEALRLLAPSWVVGAHGVAMLQAWGTPPVQQWLAQSLETLRAWKAQQLALCEQLGWQVIPGHQANYLVARLPLPPQDLARSLAALRNHGVKLRDCASFGLLGHVRLGVLPPASQAALAQAWNLLEN
ncbi:aminotransferase class I/II-fold pyridoxal phosphate-dependent enzyme [Comamonas terrigena]|uniref:aminotransferase class I/II-fold pyridoxal phosphate-dependent enzyme n=1 Tax=Comamonas terrigena TaxID=32013 RepID=UPI00244C2FCF|nr:aminotransferase class I/II-fold pyridoxal phosphate-dependent enzyme [Comamonas terrigena]MDH1703895.1 aminotransferase class I/II-fold pyridoxal phosphate-dependent enzyme [Comamonas terrigena]